MRLGVGLGVVALVVAAAGCAPDAPPAAGRVAPYVDVTLDQVPDLAAAVERGVDTFTLAFVTAGDGCEPEWGGVLPYDDPSMAARVTAVRAAGGDVRVSFGGALPTELALTCGDVDSLVAAYRKVLDRHHVGWADFDVEGAALEDRASVHRRNLAVARLPVRVSYTLPVDDDGLTEAARWLLRDAAAAGVDVAVVNVMAMNYGTGPRDLAGRAAAVARSTQELVRELWPDRSEREAWASVAVTPMLGVNDVPSEVFEVADAERLVDFAAEQGLAWLSFWSLNRDHPCRARSPRPSNYCSGVEQTEGEFTRTFARYTG